METTPYDLEIVLAWEVVDDPDEGRLFDLTELKQVGLADSECTDGPSDRLLLDAFRLPPGAVVTVSVPMEATHVHDPGTARAL